MEVAAGGQGSSRKLAALANASLDQVVLYEYERSGRLVKQVDGESGFTNIYNVYGELAAQLRSSREGRPPRGSSTTTCSGA